MASDWNFYADWGMTVHPSQWVPLDHVIFVQPNGSKVVLANRWFQLHPPLVPLPFTDDPHGK
jgi:hypothetical protein